MLEFRPLDPAQARALGRLGKMKTCPPKLIIGFDGKGNNPLVVVPASGRDRRRWDISKTGKITKCER
jgi:hypothetical protein